MKTRTKKDIKQRELSDANLIIYNEDGSIFAELSDGVWDDEKEELSSSSTKPE